MEYYELYEVLKSHFDSGKERIEIKELNVIIESISFESKVSDLLYGSEHQHCGKHKQPLEINQKGYLIYNHPTVDIKDFDIECNKKFEYYILKKADIERAEGCIFFFHGLNEKKWDKYLPWAYELAQRTKKSHYTVPYRFSYEPCGAYLERPPSHGGSSQFQKEKVSGKHEFFLCKCSNKLPVGSPPSKDILVRAPNLF